MSNPFEAPLAPAGGPPPGSGGDFDITRAYAEAWEATQRNWLVWLGVAIVSTFVLGLSLAACLLPALAVWPVVYWGTTRATLDMLDGEGDVGTVFAGFSRFGQTWAPMFVVGLGLLLLYAPALVVMFGLQFAANQVAGPESVEAMLANLLGQGVSSAWSIVVMSRFLPATYLVVEHGRGAAEAIGEAWQLTSGCWGRLMLFQLSMIPVTILGFLACCVGLIPASMIVAFAQASVYRQIIGR